ncbi:TorF family putative porin [Bradyrhizobium cenepequi]
MSILERIMVAVGIAALSSPLSMSGAAHAQTTGDQAGSIALGAKGGFSAGFQTLQTQPQGRPEDAFGYSMGAGMASDYIYRGVTLSGHQPAVGAAFEARFGSFYGRSTITSVKLPTNPAAELSFSSGVRPSLSGIDFDFGFTYFLYPGEVSTAGTDYWEFVARADRKLTEKVRVAAGFGYSPSISNTGAWSKYTAAGIGVDLPTPEILQGVSASFTTSAGYFWFGNQSPALGGFPLPAYANWNAGVTFARNRFHLDLRYYDTNLSRENCFVFTGDPNARPGGRVDPLTNPEGLTSGWCSAAVVAKFWFTLD